MLDPQIISQLQETFSTLESDLELCMFQTEHEKGKDLKSMLEDVAQTSKKITLKELDKKSEFPKFFLRKNGQESGVNFLGVPGGHEFTSLILAILNADGKGKFPDPLIQKRIQNLKGPIELKTYISLSCENCPDVVQALNIMCYVHSDFKHEMVDGAFVQDEIDKLKIQGVPTVVANGVKIHSGKISLMELLEKLESHFGTAGISDKKESIHLGSYDVVVVGAGPAGASAAIYSARKGLKTVIITDKIGGQLQETKGIENFVSIPYTEGPELSAMLHKHIQEYQIEILEHRYVEKIVSKALKTVYLNSGEYLESKALIIASGAKWRELGVPGEKEYLGQGVAYCPHCDGPFYKGKKVAVVGGGNSGVEAAIDLAGIVSHVTVLEFAPELKADQILLDKLQSLPNVDIVKNAATKEIEGEEGSVVALSYLDRSSNTEHRIELSAVFIQIGLVPNSQFIKDTVETNQFGEIEIDERCKTNVTGIYAAGDVSTVPYKQIIISMGEGAKAGLSAFEDIAFK